MRSTLKAFFLVVLGTTVLAVLHSHVDEHSVPHPHVVKVSLGKRVLPRAQLTVAPTDIAVPATAYLIATGFITSAPDATPLDGTLPLRNLRGPPCQLWRPMI